jgi:quinolinate synthase
MVEVRLLPQVLTEKKIGVVAHFYMDPEVQGVLAAAQESWPHIHISDSLVMADSAVRMAQAGCSTVLVLGVDFMSENVQAILDEAGHSDVQVTVFPSLPFHSLLCSLLWIVLRGCIAEAYCGGVE